MEDGQKQIVDALSTLDQRVRELEAGLREAKSDIRLEALRETQNAVNGVQGIMYEKIVDLSVRVDRLSSSSALQLSKGNVHGALSEESDPDSQDQG